MRQYVLAILAALSGILGASAQIGYQVAVVDQTTGEPKVNTSVSVTVTITDNSGAEITKTTQSAMTNDFGVVSLQIGNESTFADTDWSKLPLWISATVDDVSLGKTQILTVPVAAHAMHTGQLTAKKLAGEWTCNTETDITVKITFSSTGSYTEVCTHPNSDYVETTKGTYVIDGNLVATSGASFYYYSPKSGRLYCTRWGVFTK